MCVLKLVCSKLVHVCGPICESADVLGRCVISLHVRWSHFSHRALPDSTCERDVILIDSAGAYGFCMASPYNMRAPPAELVLPF